MNYRFRIKKDNIAMKKKRIKHIINIIIKIII